MARWLDGSAARQPSAQRLGAAMANANGERRQAGKQGQWGLWKEAKTRRGFAPRRVFEYSGKYSRKKGPPGFAGGTFVCYENSKLQIAKQLNSKQRSSARAAGGYSSEEADEAAEEAPSEEAPDEPEAVSDEEEEDVPWEEAPEEDSEEEEEDGGTKV